MTDSGDSSRHETLAASIPTEALTGTVGGRYKILEQIGEGGCGMVYLAEQTEPVRRRVALKVIKLGMDTKSVIARFEAERQALALMDHPNIAKVLDAGATEAGRPYFVMELVRGTKITQYCDQQCLTTRERILLFIRVCQAIQHAHQKGIIHRDIKPSNILVTVHDGVPVPKVIDFGIAKATTDQRLTDKTLFTSVEQFIGTPAYMSPEQAEMSGLDIDTRSDVYSLGVLLYELLTGKTPFEAKELLKAGLVEMRRTIRDREPIRPSTRIRGLVQDELTTAAKRRRTDAPKLIHLLRGDVDWIVVKCLEKDRTRRYETANALAMDLERHLNNEPVLARPPSASYRFQKAFRRNKLLFAAGATVSLSLVVGLGTATWLYLMEAKAYRQARSAELEQSRLRQVAVTALEGEKKQRALAEKQELQARQWAYASDMNAAQRALDENNLGRAVDLLQRQRPLPGQADLRGWEWRYLWRQTRSDALSIVGQKGAEIYSLSVSSDGEWAASSVRGPGGVSLWDLRSGREVWRLGKDEYDTRVVLSPDAQLLAYVGADRQGQSTLHVWKVGARTHVAQHTLDGQCAGLAIADDGRTVATATAAGHMTLWRIPEGTSFARYPTEQTLSIGSNFSATRDLSLAAYGAGKQIRVIDLRTGHERTMATLPKDVVTLSLTPDGKMLAACAGFDEAAIELWDVATGQGLGRLEGHRSWVTSLSFWLDGKRLASTSADQTIRLWDISARSCTDTLRGHRQEVWRAALFPDGKTLISGSKDGMVCLWDASVRHARLPRVTLPGAYAHWTFAQDGKSVLTTTGQGQVTRWTGPDFDIAEPLLDARFEDGDVSSAACISRDGSKLALGSNHGRIQVWDVPRRTLVQEWTKAGWELAALYFLDGNRQLFCATPTEGVCRILDANTGAEVQSWKLPSSINAGNFSSDDRWFVAGDAHGEVDLRNLSEKRSQRLNVDLRELEDFAFSPDAKVLAGTSSLGFARVWDLTTHREIVSLGGFLNNASAVVFAPDGKRLVVYGGGREKLRMWDTTSWLETLTLGAEGISFWPAAFSPDGNAVGVRESGSGQIQIWSAPSWDEIHRVEQREAMATGGASPE